MKFRLFKNKKTIECLECERRTVIHQKIEEIVFLKCTCGNVLISKLCKVVG